MSRPALSIRYLAGAILLGAAIALAACGGRSSASTGRSTGTNPQAQQILQRVQQANLQSANVNVQATLTSSSVGTLSTTSTGQVTLHPARAQLATSLTSASTSSGTSQGQAQEIYDNGTLYVKQSRGRFITGAVG